MQIRIVKEPELWNVLNFSAQMFWKQDLGRYTQEGKDAFLKFLEYEEQLEKFRKGEVILLAAYEQGNICGAMEIDTKGKILFFYMDTAKYSEAMAEELLYEACRFAKNAGMYMHLHVDAPTEKEPLYRQMGFVPCGEMIMEDGIQKRPCQLSVESKLNRGTPKKKSNTGVYIAVGAGAAVLVLLLMIGVFASLFVAVTRKTIEGGYPPGTHREYYHEWNGGAHDGDDHRGNDGVWNEDDSWDGGAEEWNGDDSQDSGAGNDGGVEESDDGILSLDAYIDPNAGYEIKEQAERFQSERGSAYFVAYEVHYPEVEGLSGKAGKRINETLKQCAMETIDKYYTNPSEAGKEWMLGQPDAIVASQVDYIVSYMDEDLLTVAFQDIYAAGNYNAAYIGLRAVTFDVKNGTVYRMEDVFDMDRSFAKMWKEEVTEEYPDNEFAAAYTSEDIRRLFQGEKAAEGTRPVMVLTDEGIEIGFEYRIPGTNGIDQTGYLTVVFGKDDLKHCRRDSEFWKKVKNS